MRILCVLPTVPLPPNTGGTLRALNLLRALDAAFDVTTLALDRGGDVAGLARLLRGRLIPVRRGDWPGRKLLGRLAWTLKGLPLTYEPYAGVEMRAALTSLLRSERFDLIHFDHLHTAQMLPVARRLAPSARVVIDEHNVEAQIVERLLPLSPWGLGAALSWQAKRVGALESRLLTRADAVLACSARDRGLLQWSGARLVRVVPNGVDVAALSHTPRRNRKNLVFVGSLDWWPNADAAFRLVKEIWPLAEARLPGELCVVGRNPPEALQRLASGRVRITGTVESVKPFLQGAWATAIPLRAGSGTRLKILEAAAARVPVVATRLAAEGLPLVEGEHILYAETAREFAEALVQLKREPVLAARLAEGAHRIAQQFDWSSIGQSLVDFYRAWSTEGVGWAQVAAGGP